jgi:hypothetical protein
LRVKCIHVRLPLEAALLRGGLEIQAVFDDVRFGDVLSSCKKPVVVDALIIIHVDRSCCCCCNDFVTQSSAHRSHMTDVRGRNRAGALRPKNRTLACRQPLRQSDGELTEIDEMLLQSKASNQPPMSNAISLGTVPSFRNGAKLHTSEGVRFFKSDFSFVIVLAGR